MKTIMFSSSQSCRYHGAIASASQTSVNDVSRISGYRSFWRIIMTALRIGAHCFRRPARRACISQILAREHCALIIRCG